MLTRLSKARGSLQRSSAVPDNCVQHIGNSLVSVIAVREGNFDRPGDHWFIEFGYRWSTSCHCWAIFYRTNTINKDGSCCLGPDINRQNHYQADVGPANPNEKHTFTIAQDLVDQWSVNLWIDGSHLTRLPLPAGHGGKYGWAKLAQSEINWQEVTYNATFETEFFNNPGGQPGHPTFTHNYEENLSDDPYHCNKYGDFMYSHYGPAPLWPGSCD